MPNLILKKTIDIFRAGIELPSVEAEPFFDALIAETDEQILTDLLKAWEAKGTTENELFLLASIMRRRCIRVETKHEIFIDAVGTGGSKAKTFNVSTAAAFVIAGAGIPVAKHGNRAATSNSGSADVLSALGVNPSVDAAQARKCLDKIGICFMFAPNFHRLSPTLAKVRRELGFPTIFNNLGPLCNPANAPYQVIGVWSERLVEKTANVLARLGTKKSWIVHGSDGLDEITLSGRTKVAEVSGASVRSFEISPQEFCIEFADLTGVTVSDCNESAALIRDVLGGNGANETAINLIAVNAAAAIHIASSNLDLATSFRMARESISNGAAGEKLAKLIEFTN